MMKATTSLPANTVEDNIDSAFALARAVISNPALLDDIPNGATLVLLPDDDPSRAEESKMLGLAALERGESVYFKRVDHLPV